jgi:hypothetical protein
MIGIELVVKIVVDLDGRRPATCADALNLFEREDTVSGDALVADAELFLESLENLVSAA